MLSYVYRFMYEIHLQLGLWTEHGFGHLASLDLSSCRFGDL